MSEQTVVDGSMLTVYSNVTAITRGEAQAVVRGEAVDVWPTGPSNGPYLSLTVCDWKTLRNLVDSAIEAHELDAQAVSA